MIEAAKVAGIQKLIYYSSSGVVFDGHDIVNGDESLPYPKKHLDAYTESRALAEKLVLGANDSQDLRMVIIRPAGVFG